MFHCKKVIMKFPRCEPTTMANMEKRSAAAVESKVLHLKASPVKPPTPVKPQSPPNDVTTVLFSLNDNTRPVHNKENSTSSREHDGHLDEAFEDSGYLSLHNSQLHDHHGEEEDDHIQEKPSANLLPSAAATHQEKTVSPRHSPSKKNTSRPVVVSASTPVSHHRRTAACSLSSTPSNQHDANLPILKFQQDVCEKLAKGYRKNKRFDWTIVHKVANDHLLDRVIGGHMGLEYVDMFSSLLSRNMRSILTNILSLLGDMDLISCKKVSRTWRRIICEDTAALNRCREAEQALRESRSSLRQRGCGLTRDQTVSRVVLSCMQNLASSSTPSSSSTPASRGKPRTVLSQKSHTPNCTRFTEYMQAASSLKQHESLRPCKRCGSPATHLAEVQRATCTRSSCLFDFCTNCQEAFHGSTPCRVVKPRSHFSCPKSTPIIPGSARSKRSIRRL